MEQLEVHLIYKKLEVILIDIFLNFIKDIFVVTMAYIVFRLYCLLLSHYHARLVKSYSPDLWHRYINLMRPYAALIDFVNTLFFRFFWLLGIADGFGTMYCFIKNSQDVHLRSSKVCKKMLASLPSSADRLNHLISSIELYRSNNKGPNVPNHFKVHTHGRMFHRQFVARSASESWLSYEPVKKGLSVRCRTYLAYEMYHKDINIIKSHEHYLKYVETSDWIYYFDFSKRI